MPIGIAVRIGQGQAGADRATVLWADGAIKETWLQVTLVSNGSTFYFGNTVGETGKRAPPTRMFPRPTRLVSAIIFKAAVLRL